MHRTQVYLEDTQYTALRARARREGKTLAAVIRAILADHLTGKAATGRRDPLAAAIGIAKGDGSAVAEHHADYLYGKPR